MASIKLSVTVRSALVRKYSPASLAKIDKAIDAWIAADKKRGITTVHVALDDAAAMSAQGAKALAGKVSATGAKRAIDKLSAKLAPDYIVILGGDDVLPYFHVANPSLDPQGDTDTTVPTDNPYACSRAYSAGTLKSYLVPDRVVGRIPDQPATAGQGDPSWMLASLKTATAWKPQPRSFYATAYATCTDEWKAAGLATMQYLGLPTADLMISPPTSDTTAGARTRLARSLHFTKCHGAEIDAHFYGQKGSSYPEVLFSTTVQGRVKPGTLAAAMCCYGAQVYSPADPAAVPAGALPISMSYLLSGSTGFMGSTKIAWVGSDIMQCADWIVGAYLKKALDGASIGRAMLEAKQDYLQYLVNQGQRPDTADEKTMIEFVLLGDPALHPVAASVPAPAIARKGAVGAAARSASMMRGERRIARAVVAAQVEKALPRRVQARAPTAAAARNLFKAAAGVLSRADLQLLDPARAHASRLVAPPSAARKAQAGGPVGATAPNRTLGDSLEYTWTGRRVVKGQVQVRLLKVQADAHGNVLRSRLLHSA